MWLTKAPISNNRTSDFTALLHIPKHSPEEEGVVVALPFQFTVLFVSPKTLSSSASAEYLSPEGVVVLDTGVVAAGVVDGKAANGTAELAGATFVIAD